MVRDFGYREYVNRPACLLRRFCNHGRQVLVITYQQCHHVQPRPRELGAHTIVPGVVERCLGALSRNLPTFDVGRRCGLRADGSFGVLVGTVIASRVVEPLQMEDESSIGERDSHPVAVGPFLTRGSRSG